jgi:putative pyruvate formate lyase activating enzyme
MAKKGLLVRHLVMPGGLKETREIMRFLAEQVSLDTYVNIMGQYYPAGKVDKNKYVEINRQIDTLELREAYKVAEDEGLWRFDERRLQAMAY